MFVRGAVRHKFDGGAFRKKDINGLYLLELDDGDLELDLNIENRLERKKILLRIKELRA